MLNYKGLQLNQNIKNALLNGRLVLLLGAGASKGCKNKLNEDIPLGGELAQQLAVEIGEEYCGEALSEVYSAAKDVLGEQVNTFLEKKFKYCTPSKEYIDLLKYPFFRIYSLNIDDALEAAAGRYLSKAFNVKHRNENITEPDQFYKRLDYIKLNGDIRNTKNGFIFSAQEYGSGSALEPLWYSELARDFHRYTFVFIGTALKEPLFYHQIEKFKAKTGNASLKSYILIPKLTSIEKKSLETSNIHHLEGKLNDFTEWLNGEFETPPSDMDIVKNTRPELQVEINNDSKHISLFSGVIPVGRASLALLKKETSKSKIKDFYKGFKPTWFDILEGVPAQLSRTLKFFNEALIDHKAKPSELHVLFGGAGCGKSTSLKQLALMISDEGSRNVYYIEEYKDRLVELVHELDIRNPTPYYMFIERVGGVTFELSELLKSSKSNKAIFVSSENIKIWNTRVKFYLEEHLSSSLDVSQIEDDDAEPILDKLKAYGNWTLLSKLPIKKRKLELLKKAKRQLLIGLIESTSGEGYDKIIQRDYKSISCDSEKALLILAGLATTQRVPANEATLSRALSNLGLNPNVFVLSEAMDGLVNYSNGNVTTRHRIYIEKLFNLFVPQEQLVKIITAYVEAFSVYDFPIVRNISKNEFTIYKHLVNAKSLKRIMKNDKDRVLSIYESFEKAFENEGLFLMQYGLALRSFEENEQAYEKLRIAQQAFPESPQIEHALALQRIVLACNEKDETIAMALFSEAEVVLNRLNSANVTADIDSYDRYPIITLSEGHVKVLNNLGKISDAKVIAKVYYDRLNKINNIESSPRLKITLGMLSKYYLTGKWKEKS